MSFIDRNIAKTTIDDNEIYVCMYVYQNIITNLLFFKKTEEGFQELIQQEVKEGMGKELVRRVKENEVDKASSKEVKLFERSLNQHEYHFAETVKKKLNESGEVSVEYVGSVAGLHYLVSKSKHLDISQLYMLQRDKEGISGGYLPAQFIEMTVLDYIHHMKPSEQPVFFMVSENEYIAMKKKKNAPYVYVVRIEVSPESVTASKAYVVLKENHYNYRLLPLEKSNEKIMESLKKEAQNMVDTFVKKMNMEQK